MTFWSLRAVMPATAPAPATCFFLFFFKEEMRERERGVGVGKGEVPRVVGEAPSMVDAFSSSFSFFLASLTVARLMVHFKTLMQNAIF